MWSSSALVLLLVGACLATEYHSVPRSAFDRVDYSKARFPNHPFFENKQRTVSPLVAAANCVEYYYKQQLVDHFNDDTPPLNTTMFSQRYFVCDGYWSKNNTAPIFFYTGNEADVELYVNHTGLMYELAPSFGALLVFVEHRYFGKTQPFGTQTPNYMNYLSLEQALADYAHFLRWYTQLISRPNAPIIGFGGSYGGMISSWFRMKYPGSIDGVVAGSAPILSFLYLNPPYDVNSFQQIETADATPAMGSSANCVSNVRSAFSDIFSLGNTASGRKEISAAFRLCSPLNTYSDVYNLANWLKSGWDFMAMGNYPYPSDYITNGNGILPAFPVRVACEYLNMTSSTSLDRFNALREAVAVFYNVSGSFQCFDINQSVNNQTLLDGLYWDYLYCTEILTPSGQDGVTDMFWSAPFDLSATLQGCKQQWGVISKPDWIVETYGGYQALHAASNIFFSNGILDPWHGGGVLQSTAPTVVTSLMRDSAHHLDLMFSNPLDPIDVVNTRAAEKQNIRNWIDQAIAQGPRSR